MNIVKFPENDRVTVNDAIETTILVLDCLLILATKEDKRDQIQREIRGLNIIRSRVNLILNFLSQHHE